MNEKKNVQRPIFNLPGLCLQIVIIRNVHFQRFKVEVIVTNLKKKL